MKKLFVYCLFGMLCLNVFAQEDAGRVSISAIQPNYPNIPEEARANLETKMQRLISGCGVASSESDRFIMTARVDITNKDVNTAGMSVQKMEITFIIGDVIEEKIYGTSSINVVGIGETEAKCFIKAFQAIKPNDPTLVAFVNKAKEDIITYYSNNCSFIIQDAERMAQSHQHGEAIASLVAVPKVCTDCYTACQEKAAVIYKEMIDFEGKQLIQNARSAWLVKRDYDCAAKALDILAKVNPEAPCQAEAKTLIDEINVQLRKIEATEAARRQAEWEFKVRQFEDKMALEHEKVAVWQTFANSFGRIDIGVKKERAFKFGSSSK